MVDIKRVIGVFRLDLFKGSETFIRSQAQTLSRSDSFYIGARLSGDMLPGERVVIATPRLVDKLALAIGLPYPLSRALKSAQADIVHAHFAIDGTFALSGAKSSGKPLVTTLHGFDVTTKKSEFLKSGKPALIIAALREKKLQRYGDRFICVSDFIRREAIKRGYPEAKTVTIPLGIDIERYKPTINKERDLIVHVARLVEKKGTSVLLNAMEKVVASRPSARLIVIGDGPLRFDLEAQVDRLGLARNVSFLGAVPHSEATSWIARASVVAVPSIVASDGDCEGLPTVLFEAGALATAVVATRHSGIPEAVVDGQTGLLVDERDVEGLAEALEKSLSDPDRAATMGGNARAHVELNYNARNLIKKVEAIYDELLAQREYAGRR